MRYQAALLPDGALLHGGVAGDNHCRYCELAGAFRVTSTSTSTSPTLFSTLAAVSSASLAILPPIFSAALPTSSSVFSATASLNESVVVSLPASRSTLHAPSRRSGAAI